MTAQVVCFESFGGPEVLRVRSWEEGPLGDREVRIAVSAFALNRADLMFMMGEHYTIPTFPSRIGSEACGVITELGSDVHEFAIGDRVTTIPFFTRNGVHGTSAVVPVDYVTLAPALLDDAEACSIWMQYLTAYFPFREIHPLGAGDTVLVTAAASSAGLGALQLCRELGIATVATTRSPAKVDVLKESGATAVVVDNRDLGEVVSATSSGRGLSAAFDPIGGDSLTHYVDYLATGAVVFGYGTLSDQFPIVPGAAMCRAQAVFHPYSMFNHVSNPDERQRGVALVTRALYAGRLRPRIDRIFAFDHVLDAYRYMRSNAQSGKIVVTVGDTHNQELSC